LNQPAPAGAPPSSILSALRGAQPAPPVELKNGDVLINACAPSATNYVVQVTMANPSPAQQFMEPRQSDQGQQKRNSAEWNSRANIFQQAQQVYANSEPFGADLPAPSNVNFAEGQFKGHWIGSELLLARRVNLEGRFLVQGCWLNWPGLRQTLLAGVQDLFPAADLQPMTWPTGDKQARMLAALPVKLVTGAVHLEALPSWSPIRISLAIAWLCVVLAGLAVAVLLHGTLALSERRAAFVSAVTHELRTPLTTFKMYSEMLAEDMVPDAAKRRSYLGTLCSEANRLSHLVENVLAYARLERGSARRRVERVALGELIGRVTTRLVQRTEQAGMSFVVDADERALGTVVHVDVSAVEQILFNLVDNACKYGAPGATEKLIHLEALPNGRFAMLRVRDHGQGISAEGARRLFKPFSKSAREAAHTAPGVGLGLALCRRLSRSLGGDLRLDETVTNGACFELRLPIRSGGEAAMG
jgi:signal transduction histidine kinase